MKEFKGFKRGVNLGGWLSQCDHSEERYQNFITEEDIANISKWGLDHIRIPIDYELLEDEKGNYRSNGFDLLDKGLNWAFQYGLNVIIDLHKTYGYSFDIGEKESGFFENKNHQERFYRLWEQIATHFGHYGDKVAFELLNEVTDPEVSETWNEIAHCCIQRIRKICPDTKILVGGYHNNSVEALADLRWPQDENIVYNFHCYEPLIFTHQGAYWIPTMPHEFRISLKEKAEVLNQKSVEILERPMTGYDEKWEKITGEYFERLFARAHQISVERDVPLYCGEYGVINLADPEDTLLWYEMIDAAFEKYDIGRASWSYKQMDFGLIDEHLDEVREKLLKLL